MPHFVRSAREAGSCRRLNPVGFDIGIEIAPMGTASLPRIIVLMADEKHDRCLAPPMDFLRARSVLRRVVGHRASGVAK